MGNNSKLMPPLRGKQHHSRPRRVLRSQQHAAVTAVGSPLLPAGRKDIQLVSVSVEGKQLGKEQYERTDKKLILKGLPSSDFKVDIEVQIKPQVHRSAMLVWPGTRRG